MDLICPSCHIPYDRANHVPHFLQCGDDICLACVNQYIYGNKKSLTPRSTTPGGAGMGSAQAGSGSSAAGAAAGRSRDDTGAAAAASQSQREKSTLSAAAAATTTSSSSAAGAASSSSSLAPQIAVAAYKCPRGHITPAATLNACPPVVAHRLVDQIRDKSQICPVHPRRPLEFYCMPCGKALCSVCALTHKDESSCVLPARPIAQCAHEILKRSGECKVSIDVSLRGVLNAQQTTARMLKQACSVPIDLMNSTLLAVETFHNRLLRSVDAIWRDHMTEMRQVRRVHMALADSQHMLDQYRERLAQGEKLCDGTGEAARINGGPDPLPLAAALATIDQDPALRNPLKLQLLRGIERVYVDATGHSCLAEWGEPFAGKGEFVPFAGTTSTNQAMASQLLDRASPLRRGVGAAASPLSTRDFEANGDAGRPLPPSGAVGIETVGSIGHAPLGMLSVADVLSMGLKQQHQTQQHSSHSAAPVAGGTSGSRSPTPNRNKSNATPPPENSGASPYVQLNRYPPRQRK